MEGTGQLIEEIADAFKDLSYPGDERIACDPGHCQECQECYLFFTGRHWQELAEPAVKLPFNLAGPAFLTAQAKIFFLPAYMIQGLSDADSEDCAIQILDNLRTIYEDATEALTAKQCQAVLSFVRFILEAARQTDETTLWRLISLYDYWKARVELSGV